MFFVELKSSFIEDFPGPSTDRTALKIIRSKDTPLVSWRDQWDIMGS
jgi:hypothetical protein